MPEDVEELLAEGGVTRVVRIGDTVRRPVRPFTRTVQAFLAHLHAHGFEDAPVPLGVDDLGREVLSFVPGEVPVEPLPATALEPAVLTALGRMARRLHDAAAAWTPPADAVWGGIPGVQPAGVLPLFDEPELVSHQDWCPGNVVFRDGLPAALIDFDLARPTTRVADAVNAISWWVPLVAPEDLPAAVPRADIPARIRLFADAYGMDANQRSRTVDVAVQRAANVVITMRAAADADPVFRRWWDEGLDERLPRAATWLAESTGRLHDAMR